MKKKIVKITAAALLVGGLLFNYTLNSNNGIQQNADLNAIISINVAQAENMWACPGWGWSCIFGDADNSQIMSGTGY